LAKKAPEKSRSWVGVFIFALGIGGYGHLYDRLSGWTYLRRAPGRYRTLRATIRGEEIES